MRGRRFTLVLLASVAATTIMGAGGEAATTIRVGRGFGTPRILYASDWSGTSEIYSVDPSGRTPPAQLTFGPAPACRAGPPCGFIAPNPSPDGRHLLFWDYRAGDNYSYGVFVASADASGRRLIRRFTAPAYTARDEVWAPDSRRFAYTSVDGNHLVNADGSHDRRVGGSSAGDSAPAWSPDGRLLAFSNKLGHLIVAAGSVARIIAGGVYSYAEAPAWSPTGRWIAYTTAAFRIALVSPDGRRHRTLADGFDPVWSPDGQMLAFSSAGVPTGVVDIATGATLHLDGTFAGWSPDGRTVAVRAAHSASVGYPATYPVDLVDAKTGAVRVRVSDDSESSLSWSPDGREFAYQAFAEGFSGHGGGVDLRVGSVTGPTETVVAAAGDYGGSISGWAWTRPPTGLRYQPAAPRSVATVTADQLVAPWPIQRLVADGDRVAYISCGHVFVWTPAAQTVVQTEQVASLSPACPVSPGYDTRFGVYDLALAGDRVAYGYICCNSAKSWTLWERSLVTPVRSYPLGGGDYPDNVGEAIGSGSLLVFSSWQSGYAADGHPTRQSILRAGPTGCGDCPALRTDPGPLIPDDVDANRIAAHGDNAVLVLDTDGAQLLSVPVKALATALSGNDLVVLIQGELRDYDARDGTLMHRWPLPDVPIGNDCGPVTPPWPCNDARARLRLQDATRGLAVYVLDDQVHLLRLADGTDTTIGPGTYARFMNTGLVYADGAGIHLIPYDQLPLQ